MQAQHHMKSQVYRGATATLLDDPKVLPVTDPHLLGESSDGSAISFYTIAAMQAIAFA